MASSVSFAENVFVPRLRLLRTASVWFPDAVGVGAGSVGGGVGKSVGAIVADTCGDFETCTDTVLPVAAATEAANGPLELSMSEVIWLGSTLVCPGGN